MSSDAGLYDDALATFFAEARDMLQQIVDALLALENDPHDQDTINALFRAAHTIKGSAGLFGMDRVVRFTHQVESVLDRVRNGDVVLDIALSDILLKSSDVVSILLAQVEQKIETPEHLLEMDRNAAAMAKELASYLQVEKIVTEDVASISATVATERRISDGVNAAGIWHISLRFGQDAFRNGFDPLSVIHYLRSIGDIVQILTIVDKLPEFEALDPEACFLGFEIRLQQPRPKLKQHLNLSVAIVTCASCRQTGALQTTLP